MAPQNRAYSIKACAQERTKGAALHLAVGYNIFMHIPKLSTGLLEVCVCIYPFCPEGGFTLFEEHWASK